MRGKKKSPMDEQVRQWHEYLVKEMKELGFKMFFEENFEGHKWPPDKKPNWMWQTYWYMPDCALMFMLQADHDNDGLDHAQAYCFFQVSDFDVKVGQILKRIPRDAAGSECHSLGYSINDCWTGDFPERVIRFFHNCLTALREIVDHVFIEAGIETQYWTPWYAERGLILFSCW